MVIGSLLTYSLTQKFKQSGNRNSIITINKTLVLPDIFMSFANRAHKLTKYLNITTHFIRHCSAKAFRNNHNIFMLPTRNTRHTLLFSIDKKVKITCTGYCFGAQQSALDNQENNLILLLLMILIAVTFRATYGAFYKINTDVYIKAQK